jgi:GxxExxY protein
MPNLNEKYLFEEETYEIIGACMAVHRELGAGFLEQVYQEALSIEFEASNVPFSKEQRLEVTYKDQVLDKFYYADFVCYGKIIVELKAIETLLKEHKAQVLNYLKATGYKLGLLINFGAQSLEYKRVIL